MNPSIRSISASLTYGSFNLKNILFINLFFYSLFSNFALYGVRFLRFLIFLECIFKYFPLQGYAVDKNLQPKSKHLSTAYANWVFTRLHAYYNYYLFGEPNNYEVTRTLYAKRTPFPFNFHYPATYQKRAYDIVMAMANFDLYDKIDKHEGDYVSITFIDL